MSATRKPKAAASDALATRSAAQPSTVAALEAQLRELEQRYRALVVASGHLTWAHRPGDLTPEDIPSWRAYTGQTTEDIRDHGWLRAIHPDDRERTAHAWAQAVAARGLYENECRIRRHDDVYRRFIVRGVPILADDGAIREWVGTCMDVSERREAEDERARLLESERLARMEAASRASQLEAVFEAMTDPVMVFDRDGSIVQVNSAARRIIARTVQPEYADLPFEQRVADHIMRDEHGAPLPHDQWPARRLLSGEVLAGANALDVRFPTLDGGELMLNIAGAPVRDAGGHIIGGVAIYRDVTGRRELERRAHEALQALLTMAEAFVQPLTDDDEEASASGGVARRLAELTCSVLGCTRVGIVSIEPRTLILRAVTVVGLSEEQERQWWAEQHAQQEQQIRLGDGADPELMARFLAGEALVLDMTQPPYDQQPNPYGVTTSLVAPMRAAGRLVGLLSLDYGGPPHAFTPTEIALSEAVATLSALVVERERLLRERAQAEAHALALREANRRMDEFLSIASHELKTPLTIIKLNAQIAERQLTRARATDSSTEAMSRAVETARLYFQHADRGLVRLTRLVDDLLDVSRIRAGKLEFRPEVVDLTHVVRQVVEDQRQVEETRDIRVCLPSRQVSVVADPDRIAQVVLNYLTNALKYSPSDRPVDVSLSVEGDSARVCVHDEGPGLPPEEHERVWTMFHRAQGIEVRSGTGVGLGLGLHISRTIIERHQGAVGIESEVGQGSTFWFTVPLATPAQVSSTTDHPDESQQIAGPEGAR